MPLGKLLNNIFGSEVEYQPTKFNAGGFTGQDGSITSTPERLGLVGSISDTFKDLAGRTGDLLGKVTPGFSAFRTARLNEIENSRQSAIGNLRENLQRRRVLGSSFGQDALTRAEAEFGKEKERVAAESFLTELDVTNRLNQQRAAERASSFKAFLDNMNLEAQIALPLAQQASKEMNAAARLEAEFGFKTASGFGEMFGKLLFSDARLKRDISFLGWLAEGLGLYRFRYLWSDIEYTGVMAHEAAAFKPDAVVRGPGGYLMVDYAKLGLRMGGGHG